MFDGLDPQSKRVLYLNRANRVLNVEMIFKITLVLVGLYAVFITGCAVMQRSLMYFPSGSLPHPKDVGLESMKEIVLKTADGLNLVAWYGVPKAGLPTLVYFHGNGGNISGRADKVRPFLQSGLGVLLVSYRGYGGNPGKPTETGLFYDGRAAFDYIKNLGTEESDIIIIGESLGTGVAVKMATEFAVKGLILEAPFTSAADVGQRAFPILPVKFLILDRFDSLKRIADIDAPLLIVHGERDKTVPVKLGKELFAKAKKPKVGHFLEKSGHNNLIDHGLLKIEMDFISSLKRR